MKEKGKEENEVFEGGKEADEGIMGERKGERMGVKDILHRYER